MGEFEKAIAPCKHILYFEVSDETMTKRLLKRAETSGRADDNEETIKKRLVTFHQHSEPVIKHYASKCSVIPAERGIDDIFACLQSWQNAPQRPSVRLPQLSPQMKVFLASQRHIASLEAQVAGSSFGADHLHEVQFE